MLAPLLGAISLQHAPKNIALYVQTDQRSVECSCICIHWRVEGKVGVSRQNMEGDAHAQDETDYVFCMFGKRTPVFASS